MQNRYLGLLYPISILLLVLFLSMHWQTITLYLPPFALATKIIKYAIDTCVWLTLAWLVNKLIDLFIWNLIFEKKSNTKVTRLVKDTLKFFIFFLATLSIIGIVFEKSITGLLTASGIIGLIVGLAIKNLIADVFNGVAISADKAFSMGDLIIVHDKSISGVLKVMEITWRTTRFQNDNNDILIIPNSRLSTMAISNLSEHKQGNFGFAIKLDADVPIDRALRILAAAIKSTDGVLQNPSANVNVSDISGNGVTYYISYWLVPSQTSPSQAKHNITSNVLNHMHQAGLRSALSEAIVYHAHLSGKDISGLPPPETFIKRIALFEQLEDSEQKFIVDNLKVHYYKVNTLVAEIGTTGDSMFIVVEGLLQVFIKSELDPEQFINVGHISCGEYFGEMSLLTGEQRSANVKTATDVILYEIDKKAMQQLLTNNPSLSEKLAYEIAKRKNINLQIQQDMLTLAEHEKQTQTIAMQIAEKIKHFFSLFNRE